jgi:hypothetical protein
MASSLQITSYMSEGKGDSNCCLMRIEFLYEVMKNFGNR